MTNGNKPKKFLATAYCITEYLLSIDLMMIPITSSRKIPMRTYMIALCKELKLLLFKLNLLLIMHICM